NSGKINSRLPKISCLPVEAGVVYWRSRGSTGPYNRFGRWERTQSREADVIAKLILKTACIAGLTLGYAFAQAPAAAPAAVPADGITMDMMPITQEQLTQCRQQASGQLTDEQKALHDREHGQDKDKIAQGG